MPSDEVSAKGFSIRAEQLGGALAELGAAAVYSLLLRPSAKSAPLDQLV